jgi:hypothetical protein
MRTMSVRRPLKLAALALLLPILLANRTVPKWQAIRNVSLPITERCVRSELRRFGDVKVERGEEPEAGKTRMFLAHTSAGMPSTVATIYLNGERGFSALWMDANDSSLGNHIWRRLKRRCRLI